MTSSVRLAVAPIAWSNDDMPELGGSTPLDVCLAESRLAGFCGTELSAKFPRDATVLAPLLQQHGLHLASGWFSGLLRKNGSVSKEMRRMRTQLECFAALGVQTLFYAETTDSVQGQFETPLSQRPLMADSEFPAYGERLTVLAERMAVDYGVTMAYHHHKGTVVEIEREVDLLMMHSGDAVGLLVDSGHAAFAGCDGVTLLQRYAARVRHIHCKDVRADQQAAAHAGDWSFMRSVLEGVFTVPGDGAIDFDAFLAAVAAINYNGWLVVEAEQDPAKANPLHYSRMGGAHLRDGCARAGITVIDD